MKYTTVCVTADQKVYNLGKGQYPPAAPGKDGVIREDKYRVINAFTCTVEEANRLQRKKK